ncbi:unnamed protein product [Gongylonema pulchrum]|uniref:Transposase n=1 Tax=Gongylonema pulchrum TaxID=637853 RepID=A0A183DFW7_9BILA|nr:unnamed protein product [Gongylonema pulchrum]
MYQQRTTERHLNGVSKNISEKVPRPRSGVSGVIKTLYAKRKKMGIDFFDKGGRRQGELHELLSIVTRRLGRSPV